MKLDFTSDINHDYARVMNYDVVDRFMVRILWWHCVAVSALAWEGRPPILSAGVRSPSGWPWLPRYRHKARRPTACGG